ncbi:MAG TPA: hypothetical protein VM389_13425, partial [Phycisphaerae bacterium]|nr:hypothetical protein [Phycisphaerae bacterium]
MGADYGANAVDRILQSSTPSEVNAAYTDALAAHRTDARFHETYLRRMVDLGQADAVSDQARTLLALEPDNGFAWAVIAFDHAGSGEMPEAFSAAVRAAEKLPNDPFVGSLGGQLVGWYDLQTDRSAIPAEVAQNAEKLRKTLGGREPFIEGRRIAMEGLTVVEPEPTEDFNTPAVEPSEPVAPFEPTPPSVMIEPGEEPAESDLAVAIASEPVWTGAYVTQSPYSPYYFYPYEYPYYTWYTYPYGHYYEGSYYPFFPYNAYAAYYVPYIVFHVWHRGHHRDAYFRGHFYGREGRLRFRPYRRDDGRQPRIAPPPGRGPARRGNVIGPLQGRRDGRLGQPGRTRVLAPPARGPRSPTAPRPGTRAVPPTAPTRPRVGTPARQPQRMQTPARTPIGPGQPGWLASPTGTPTPRGGVTGS